MARKSSRKGCDSSGLKKRGIKNNPCKHRRARLTQLEGCAGSQGLYIAYHNKGDKSMKTKKKK